MCICVCKGKKLHLAQQPYKSDRVPGKRNCSKKGCVKTLDLKVSSTLDGNKQGTFQVLLHVRLPFAFGLYFFSSELIHLLCHTQHEGNSFVLQAEMKDLSAVK